MKIAFLSDVHISVDSPNRLNKFRKFIKTYATSLDRLYLIGDIFDYWIGPGHLKLPDYREVIEMLRLASYNGLKIYLIYGNRDYLICDRFSRITGVTLLGSESVIALNGHKVLLAHGDFIYNRNIRYTTYRRLMAFSIIRNIYTSLMPQVGKWVALRYRAISKRDNEERYSSFGKDLITPTIEVFRNGYDVLICGHIHKPQTISFTLNGRRCNVFVLGDWDDGCEYVEYCDGRFTLKPFA